MNAQFHSEDFQWQPEKGVTVESTSTLIKQEKDEKLMECPVCHNKCNPDLGYCEKCGTKFMLFGVNLAKELQKEQEKTKENESGGEGKVEPYAPPFEIGVGEGFEDAQNTDSEVKITAEQVQQSIINALGGSGEKYPEDGVQKLYFKGPYTAKDKIDGVSTNAVGTFIRNDALRYIDKFSRMTKGSLSFNWGAAFFSPFWFFYRKLYKQGIIFMTIELVVAIFYTYFSYEMVAEMMNLGISSGTELTYEALYEMLTPRLMELSSCIMVCMLALVVTHVAAGLLANRMYKKYVLGHVRIMEQKSNLNQALVYGAKFGGASIMGFAISVFIYVIGSYAIGMFFV